MTGYVNYFKAICFRLGTLKGKGEGGISYERRVLS